MERGAPPFSGVRVQRELGNQNDFSAGFLYPSVHLPLIIRKNAEPHHLFDQRIPELAAAQINRILRAKTNEDNQALADGCHVLTFNGDFSLTEQDKEQLVPEETSKEEVSAPEAGIGEKEAKTQGEPEKTDGNA